MNQGPATLNPVETGAETRAETGAKTGAETGLPLENKLASGAPYNHGCVEASRGKRRDSRGQTGRLSINRGHLLTHLHNFSIVSAVNFDWIRLWRWVGQWAAGWLGGRGGMSMNRCFRLLSHLEIAGGSNNTPKQHPTTFDNIQQHSTTSNNNSSAPNDNIDASALAGDKNNLSDRFVDLRAHYSSHPSPSSPSSSSTFPIPVKFPKNMKTKEQRRREVERNC